MSSNPAKAPMILPSDEKRGPPGVTMRGASFGDADQAWLHDLDLDVRPGQLTMLIGQVGSGKTSVLSAILGELDLRGGYVEADDLGGRVAFAPQDAVMLAGTIRSNIAFGDDDGPAFDQERFRRAVAGAALTDDLAAFPEGDQHSAEQLSGGQRQRVGLARCLYAKGADLVLLDDVFSALDAMTEANVFDALFGVDGALRGRTVVLVSNDPRRFSVADHLVYLRDGRIAEQGRYEDLVAAHGPTLAMVKRGRRTVSSAAVKESSVRPSAAAGLAPASAGFHMTDLDQEARAAGVVGLLPALQAWLRAGSRAWALSSLVFGSSTVALFFAGFAVYLRFWVQADSQFSAVADWCIGLVGLTLLFALVAAALYVT